jgi:Ca2+-binding RTX toxin-like protein
VICARGGNDLIWALGGPDAVRAGAGADQLRGGGGMDYLYGDNGNDRFWTKDSVVDRVFGGAGRDCVASSDSFDIIKSANRGC